MGCCQSQKTSDNHQTVGNRRRIVTRVAPEIPAPPPFVPGPVTNLKISLVNNLEQSPSILLTWHRPDNCTYLTDLKHYHVEIFTQVGDSQAATAGGSEYRLRPFKVSGNFMHLMVNCEDGLIPLASYTVEVRAESLEGTIGDKAEGVIFIHWPCRLPGCDRDRTVMNPECTTLEEREVYDFCSLNHKSESDKKYCLFPECTIEKSLSPQSPNSKYPTHSQSHFCSEQHLLEAKESNLGFFVELDPTTKEFIDLSKKFKKTWSSKKGPCPTLKTVFAIINPALEDNLMNYKKSLSKWHAKTKDYFHGTGFVCDLERYQTPCSRSEGCGVCGISREGFQKECIHQDGWQRYGEGFYFAPNSSKSHAYCSKPESANCFSMLLCQVAPGKNFTSRTNMSDLEEPPRGYDSVYGKKKSFLHSSVLNYDEVVVFNGDAVCPRYVLLYS